MQARSARAVSLWLNSGAEDGSEERMLVDLLVANILRGKPRLRELSDRFDLPKSNIGRLASAYQVLLEGSRRAALVRLERRLSGDGLVVP